MTRFLQLLLIVLLLAAAPGARAADAFAGFDRAIADTKAAMMGDPQQALVKADSALGRAQALPKGPRAEIALATAEWLKGEALIFLNRPQEAAPIVDAALTRVLRHAPRSKLHGDLLRSRGAIAATAGRAQDALRDFQRAFQQFVAAGEARSQAIALQDIGQIYWDAQDYRRVLDYYRQASELYTADPAFALTSHNNLGEVLRKLGRYDEAAKQYSQALGSARALNSPLLEVRILSNLAEAQTDGGRTSIAARSIDQALALSNAGEAAGWRPFVLGVAAKVAIAQGDLRRAAQLYEMTFAGLDLTKTDMPFKDFHAKAAHVFETLGEKDQALAHLKAFQRLDSSARDLTATTNAQLMASRFDFANQNLKISQLKRGQAERDLQIERQRTQYRTIVFVGVVIAGGVVFTLLLVGSLRIRRSHREVRAANIVLAETNTALEKALKAKTDFLAMTSHEIRTPLNGILGMTQILLANRALEEEMRDQVQLLQGAGETMKALVDDILDVAKMETGDVAVAQEETRIRPILDDAIALWRAKAEEKGLTLATEIGALPQAIRSDPNRLRQIVFNLLSNAIKFTAHGSVTLRATIETADAGDALVIAITDSGIGIAHDQQEKVFEAFHQVDAGTTRQFGGTGLGLAICRNLARALGGDIDVASVLGHGSTFTLRVPAERVEATRADAGPTQRPVALDAARLLLVEGNAMMQGVLRTLLEPAVAQFASVDDAGTAIAVVAAGGTDHVLIEARSAAHAGLDALAGLAALIAAARSVDVPVTVLLAPSDALPLGDVAALAPDQLILKPVGGAKLVSMLHETYVNRTRCVAAA